MGNLRDSELARLSTNGAQEFAFEKRKISAIICGICGRFFTENVREMILYDVFLREISYK